MAETKYTMIGMSAAGKTSYITALYMKMATGFDGFTLVTDDKTRTRLERDILQLREPSGQLRFPTATSEAITMLYEFKLSYETKKIISFEILDYAGGSLRSESSDTFIRIGQSIAESTVLYIFVDGSLFCTENNEERRENLYYDCAMTVAPMIQKFADAHGMLPPIVFIVTKADLYKKYVDSDEVASIIREYFSAAFGKNTYTYISEVSLGDTISENEYKGRFKPVNIYIPFFIGSYHEFYNRCVMLNGDATSKNRNEVEKIQLANAKINIEQGKWKIFRDDSYIESCREAVKEAESVMKSNQKVLDHTMSLFNKFGSFLAGESSKFKCFIDGVESKFEIFKI